MKRKYLGEKSLKDLIDFIKGDLNEKINTKDHITEDKTIEIWNSITGAEIPNANSLIHNHNELYYLKSEIDRMLELLSYNDIGADPAGSAEAVQTNLTSHANDRSNPHEVTCEQISALPLTGGTMSGTIISDLNNSDDTPELQSNLDNGSLLKLYVNNKNNKASIRFGTDDTLPPEDDKRITLRGLKDPVDSSDGVNKAYVDNAIMHYGVYDTSTSIDGSDFVAFKDSSEDTAKKISLTDLKDIITNNFAICDTEANIAEKIVTIPNLTIRNGTRIIVYFANNNSIEHPTLNVNGIGPLEMKYEAGHFTDSPINIIYNFLQGLNEFVYIEMGDKKYWYRSGYMEKAYSATRLHNYRSIDGVKYNGNNDIYHFGVCTTAANVSAKTVSLSNTFVLTNGSRIAVYFEYENTAARPTLNVNGTGAGYISCNVGNYATNGSWTAKTIVEFVYYNQHWVMLTSHATRLSKARNIQTNLASTSTASFDGTANVTPGVTGILHITNGGTGNTTGLAASATKLATARTISLTSEVTGSTTFDGTANKSISCTLSNTGVVANTYGCDVSKMAIDKWCSNNRGIQRTTATSIWVAKSAFTLKFTYTVSSENVSYDYLNITAAGSQLLADTGGNKTSGTLTKALSAGQSIVFNYRKDGSGNKNDDCAIISAVKITPSGGTETIITTSNINSYFTITDSTYAFLPLVELIPKETAAGATSTGTNAFTLPTLTVNAKGRVTSASRVLIMPTNSSGLLPIANGGTGATTAASALAKLGGLPLTGGTLTGNLTIKKGNYGNILNFGDGDYVHISEPTDDNMEIKAKNVNFVVSGDVTKNGSSLGGSMNRSQIEQKLVCTGGSYVDTVAIGFNALSSNRSSSGNTAVGRGALSKNTSGNYNTAIGYSALVSTASYSWNTGVGFNATVTGSKQVQLGDSDVTVYAQRSLATRSDRRDKVDINDSNLGLNFITKLRPVSYKMNPRESYFNNVNEDIVEETDEDGNTIQVTRETVEFQDIDYSLTNDGSRARKRPHYGLIAQEVKEVMNELDIDFAGYLDASYDGGEDVLSLSYTEFIAPMIKAIQEQQEMINELKKEVELLKTP